MPFRNMYVGGQESILMITPRGEIASDTNVFDKSFSGTDMEDWDDWMRGEGTNAELDEIPYLDCKDSGLSSTTPWFSEVESPLSHATSDFFPDPDFHFDHTAFEIENSQPHRYCSLTASEERTLQAIAMPSFIQLPLPSPSSPSSSFHTSASTTPEPEPEPSTSGRKTKTKKRKISPATSPAALNQSRKRGHNAIEKRYRTNLNEKIAELRAGIPSLHHLNPDQEEADSEVEDGDEKTQKYGKAAILTRALEYIKHLEMTTQRFGREVVVLKTRVGAFERLAVGGSSVLAGGAGGVVVGECVVVKKETLEDIQADFKQIRPRCKANASERRKQSKVTKT